MSGAISTHRAIHRTEENLWQQLSVIVTIEEDTVFTEGYFAVNGVWPDFLSMLEMSELLAEIGELPYVSIMDASMIRYLYSQTLARYWNPVDLETGEQINIMDFEGIKAHRDDALFERFVVKGVSHPSFVEIETGIIELIVGELFTEEQLLSGSPVILISQELANENDLIVGSIITLQSVAFDIVTENWTPHARYESEYVIDYLEIEFEVVGIFELAMPISQGQEWDSERNAQLLNRIYAPISIIANAESFVVEASNLLWESRGWDTINASDNLLENLILLDDPRNLSAFHVAAQETLPEFMTVREQENSFDDIRIAMNNIQRISTLIVLLSIVSTLVILSLLVTFSLRDRRHEMGIYLALGEKKKRIVFQLLMEIMLTSIIAMSLSLVTGSLVSHAISNHLLQREFIAQERNRDISIIYFHELDWFSTGNVTVQEMIEDNHLALTGIEITVFYLIGSITVFLSITIPIFNTMRLSPKEVLM